MSENFKIFMAAGVCEDFCRFFDTGCCIAIFYYYFCVIF